MKHKSNLNDIFGFIKPLVDVHTMGIFTMANLLRDCGYKVFIANDDVAKAVEDIHKLNNYSLVKKWILENNINRLGFSYRLDPQEGCDYFMSLYEHLRGDNMMKVLVPTFHLPGYLILVRWWPQKLKGKCFVLRVTNLP